MNNLNLSDLKLRYSNGCHYSDNVICKLIDLLETKDDEIEFWMGEGDTCLCEEDVEWRKLVEISHEDRTDEQNNRVRELATIIREKHDEGLLWAKIQRLEAGLIQIDNLRHTVDATGEVFDAFVTAANIARETLGARR